MHHKQSSASQVEAAGGVVCCSWLLLYASYTGRWCSLLLLSRVLGRPLLILPAYNLLLVAVIVGSVMAMYR